MTRDEQKKMIEEYIKKNGVTRVAADTRGKDFLDQEFELRRKKLKAKLVQERAARKRRFKLLDKG
tara:strand:- start:389 stop:583 length:195 start_codon:yes stop_codon:yes gene_type:complete